MLDSIMNEYMLEGYLFEKKASEEAEKSEKKEEKEEKTEQEKEAEYNFYGFMKEAMEQKPCLTQEDVAKRDYALSVIKEAQSNCDILDKKKEKAEKKKEMSKKASDEEMEKEANPILQKLKQMGQAGFGKAKQKLQGAGDDAALLKDKMMGDQGLPSFFSKGNYSDLKQVGGAGLGGLGLGALGLSQMGGEEPPADPSFLENIRSYLGG